MLKFYEKKVMIRKLMTGQAAVIKEVVDTLPAVDIAILLDTPTKIDPRKVFTAISPRKSMQTFKYLHKDSQFRLLKLLPLKRTMEILNRMSPDDRTAFFEYIPRSELKKWLGLLSSEQQAVAKSLLSYPENSIGRLMNPSFITVKPTWSVAQVLAHIRKLGQAVESLDDIYVTDEKGFLIDDIKIRTIVLSPLDRKISELMDHRLVCLNAEEDEEEAVKAFKATRSYVLPVTDARGFLVGVVTIDDLVHIMDEKSTKDIHKIGGSEFFSEQYFNIPVLKMLRKRASWLVLLFIGEMLTATAMGYFEGEIAKAVVLALFVPLVISSGGNSGSQSSTIIIRSLALGEIHLSDWFKVFRRELSTGLLLGGILGIIGILRISIWSLFSPVYGPNWPLIALTVGVALVGIVLWGTLTGSMLPLILHKLGLDPAVSSAPFVATLVDVTGLLIYFSTALIFLKGTLL